LQLAVNKEEKSRDVNPSVGENLSGGVSSRVTSKVGESGTQHSLKENRMLADVNLPSGRSPTSNPLYDVRHDPVLSK
jgi:hypothetical protein